MIGMKRYKTYLEASNKEVPRSTGHRRSKHNTANKENLTRAVYKRFVGGSTSEVPRTSQFRKRKILQTVHHCGNEVSKENNQVVSLQPSKRVKQTTHDQSQYCMSRNASVPHLPFNLSQLSLPQETEMDQNNLQTEFYGPNDTDRENETIQETQDISGGGQTDQTENCTTTPSSFCIPTCDDVLCPGASLTKGQSLLLLMTCILRHNLTGTALEHLLKMFNEFFPGSMPATSYLFHKEYGKNGHYETHFYCSGCTNYIGKGDDQTQCSVCQTLFDTQTNLKNGSYFLVLTLSSQIKDILGNPQIALARTLLSDSIISDIHSGIEYDKLIKSGEMGDDDISLIWNCDGIPVFKI